MRAGLLRHRVTVQAPDAGQSASGMPVTGWSALATRWAAVEPLQGREFDGGDRTNAEVTHRIRMRYDATLAAVTPKHRVAWGSRVFDIESVINVAERGKTLELLCVEVV